MTSVVEEDGIDISLCSDEERRKLLKPAPTEEQLLQLLKDNYCEEEKKDDDSACKLIQQLDSYDDVNWKVKIDGKPYLLKIHNGVESEDFLEQTNEDSSIADKAAINGGCFYRKGHMKSIIHLQNAMQELLSQHGLVTTMPVRPLKGRTSDEKEKGSPALVASLPVTSSKHSPRQLVVRLLTWVSGKPLSSVQVYSLEVLADAGRFLGLIDKTLDNINSNSLAGALERVGSSAALLSRSSFVGRSSMMNPPPPSVRGSFATGGRSQSITRQRSSDSAMDRILASLGMKKKPPNSNGSKGDAVLDESLLVPARRYHQWDGKNTADLRRFVQHIDNTRRRDLVVSVIDAFQRDVLDSGAADRFRKGVNHGDFNDANILMDDNLKVAGIIDFGDSVER